MSQLLLKARRWHEPGSEPYGHVLMLQVRAARIDTDSVCLMFLPKPFLHSAEVLPGAHVCEPSHTAVQLEHQVCSTPCGSWECEIARRRRRWDGGDHFPCLNEGQKDRRRGALQGMDYPPRRLAAPRQPGRRKQADYRTGVQVLCLRGSVSDPHRGTLAGYLSSTSVFQTAQRTAWRFCVLVFPTGAG